MGPDRNRGAVVGEVEVALAPLVVDLAEGLSASTLADTIGLSLIELIDPRTYDGGNISK